MKTPAAAIAGMRSTTLKAADVAAFAELEGDGLEVNEDGGDDDDPDVGGWKDDTLELRLVESEIMDIKMGATVSEGVVGEGVDVATLAGGNGHQKSYVDDVVGVLVVRVTGLCRRNGTP
jgi:hypothetical protein